LENRACCYGITGRQANGMHVMEVYEAVKEAAEAVRADSFPGYLVLDTYRFEGHHTADKQTYRTVDETVSEFRERDPIHILEVEMIDDHTVDIDTTIAYRDRVRQEVDDAFERALKEPWPEAEEALSGAYSDEGVA
jgi:TPP-dependent pyruvate/acetoin dehydrogenase alpha subunit